MMLKLCHIDFQIIQNLIRNCTKNHSEIIPNSSKNDPKIRRVSLKVSSSVSEGRGVWGGVLPFRGAAAVVLAASGGNGDWIAQTVGRGRLKSVGDETPAGCR